MSLVVSIIHEKLFQNMKNLEDTSIELINKYADNKDGQAFIAKTEYLPKGKLEEIIDTGNIHKWLSENLEKSEKNYANSMEFLLENKFVELEELIEVFYNKGKEISGVDTPLDLFRFLKGSSLDGMPCDRAVEILDEKDGYLMWSRSRDMHGMYWKDGGETFYMLRNAWLKGICDENDLVININNTIYEVKLCTE